MTCGHQIQVKMECCRTQSSPSSDIQCSLHCQERPINCTAQCSISEVFLSPINNHESFRTNRHKLFRRNEDNQKSCSAPEELTPPALRCIETNVENLGALPFDEMINVSEMSNKSALVEGPDYFSSDKFWDYKLNTLASGKTHSAERHRKSPAKGSVTCAISASCSPTRSLSRHRHPNLPKPQVTGPDPSQPVRVFSNCQPDTLSPENIVAEIDTMINETFTIYDNHSSSYSYTDDAMVQTCTKYLVTLAQTASAYRNKSTNSGYNEKKLPKKKKKKIELTLQAGSSHERGLQLCLEKARLACALQGSVGLMGNRADNYAASLAYQQSVKDFETSMKEFLKEKSDECEASLQARSQPNALPDAPTDESNLESMGLTSAASFLRSETFVVDQLTISRSPRSRNQRTFEKESAVNEHGQQERVALDTELSTESLSRGLFMASSASYTIVAKDNSQVDHKPLDAHASQTSWYETQTSSCVLGQDQTVASKNKHMTKNWFTPEKESNRSSACRSLVGSDRLPLLRSEKLNYDSKSTDKLNKYRYNNKDTSRTICTKEEDYESIRAYGNSFCGGSPETPGVLATRSSDAGTSRKLDHKTDLRPKKGITVGIYKRIPANFDDFTGFHQHSPDIDSQNCHPVRDDWRSDNEEWSESVVTDSRTLPNKKDLTERFTDYREQNGSLEWSSTIESVDQALDKTFCRLHDSQPTAAFPRGNSKIDTISLSKDNSHDKIGPSKYSDLFVVPSQKSPAKLTPVDQRKDNERSKKKWQRTGQSKPPFNPGLGAENPVKDRSSSDEDVMDDLQSEPSPSDLLRHRQKMEVATKLEELNQLAKRKKKAKSPLRKRTFPDLVWMNKDISNDDLEEFTERRGGAINDSSKSQQPLPAHSCDKINNEEKQTDDATGNVLVSQPENVCLSVSQLFHSKAEAEEEHCLNRGTAQTAAETVLEGAETVLEEDETVLEEDETVLEGENTTEIKTSGVPEDDDSAKASVFSVEARTDLPENSQNENLTTTNSSPSSTSAEYILHPMTDGVMETISAPQLIREFTVLNVAPDCSCSHQRIGTSRAMQSLASGKDQFQDQFDAHAMSGLSVGCDNHAKPETHSNMAPERFKFKRDKQRTPFTIDKSMGSNEEHDTERDLVTHKIRPSTFNKISETEQLIREKSATELNVKRFPYPETYVTLEDNPTLDISALSTDEPRLRDQSPGPVDADEIPLPCTPRTSHTDAEREDSAKTYSVKSPPKPNISTRGLIHSYPVDETATPRGVSEKDGKYHDSSREGRLKETNSFSLLADEVEFESNHDSETSHFVQASTVGKEDKRMDSEYLSQTVSDRSESDTEDEEQLLDSQSRLVNMNSASSEVSRARNDSSGSSNPGERRRMDSCEAREGSGSGTYQQIRNSQSLEQDSLDCMATDRGTMEQKVQELKEKVEGLERILGYHRQCCNSMQQPNLDNQPESLFRCWCHPLCAAAVPGPSLFEPHECKVPHTVNFSPAGPAAGSGAPSQSCPCPAGLNFQWFSTWSCGAKPREACQGLSACSCVTPAGQIGGSPGSDSGDPHLGAGITPDAHNRAQSQTGTEAGTMGACTSGRTQMSQMFQIQKDTQHSTDNSQRLHNSIVSLQKEVDNHRKELVEMRYLLEKIASSLTESQRDQAPGNQELETLRHRVADLTLQRDAEKVFHRITRQSLRALQQDHDRLRQEYVLANCRRCRTGDSVVQTRVWTYLNNDVNPGNHLQDENHNHRPEWRPGYTGRLAVHLDGSGYFCSRKMTSKDISINSCSGKKTDKEMPMDSCLGKKMCQDMRMDFCSEKKTGKDRRMDFCSEKKMGQDMRMDFCSEKKTGKDMQMDFCSEKKTGKDRRMDSCSRKMTGKDMRIDSCSEKKTDKDIPMNTCSGQASDIEKLAERCSKVAGVAKKSKQINSQTLADIKGPSSFGESKDGSSGCGSELAGGLCPRLVHAVRPTGSCSRLRAELEIPPESCSRNTGAVGKLHRKCLNLVARVGKPHRSISVVVGKARIQKRLCPFLVTDTEKPESSSGNITYAKMPKRSCSKIAANAEKSNRFNSYVSPCIKKNDKLCSRVVVDYKCWPQSCSLVAAGKDGSCSRSGDNKEKPGVSCSSAVAHARKSDLSSTNVIADVQRKGPFCLQVEAAKKSSRIFRSLEAETDKNPENVCSVTIVPIKRSVGSCPRGVTDKVRSGVSCLQLVDFQERSRRSSSPMVGSTESSVRFCSPMVGSTERSRRSSSPMVGSTERSPRSCSPLVGSTERSRRSCSPMVGSTERSRGSCSPMVGSTERSPRSCSPMVGSTERSPRSCSSIVGSTERSRSPRSRMVCGLERSRSSCSRLVLDVKRSRRSRARLVGGLERPRRSCSPMMENQEGSCKFPTLVLDDMRRSRNSRQFHSTLICNLRKSHGSCTQLDDGLRKSGRSPSRSIGVIEQASRFPSRYVYGIDQSSRSHSRLVRNQDRSRDSSSRLIVCKEMLGRTPSQLVGGSERSKRSPLQLVADLQKSSKSRQPQLPMEYDVRTSRESLSNLVCRQHCPRKSSTPGVIKLDTSRRSFSSIGNGLERNGGSRPRMVGDLDRLRRSHSPVVVYQERSHISCSQVNCGIERFSKCYPQVDDGHQGLRTSRPRILSSMKRQDSSCSRNGNINRHS